MITNEKYYSQILIVYYYSAKSKHYEDSNKLVIGKMKDENCVAAIEEFVGLKAKMYSFSVDGNSEHKKNKRCEQKCCCNNKS